ncbi:MAG: hypothetical protein AAGA55_00585 [Planctomycetota bacterium]
MKFVAICMLAGSAAAASADLIDFEDFEHGRIIDTQYESLGVSVSAINFNRSFDLAVAFNTNLDGTRDPDLEGPWTGGNLPADTDIGNILIVQENNNGIGDGIADRPDDEGRRAAGQLIFDFDRVFWNIGFDLVDLEDATSETSSIELFRGGSSVASIGFEEFESGGDYDRGAAYGDNSLNRIDPIAIAGGFDRAVFTLGGSAGIDNVFYSLPSPGVTMLLGVSGIMASRRRR